MGLRIGCTPYMNTLPIHLPFSLGKIQSDLEFVYAIPSELNVLLREQKVDIALTSSVESLDVPYIYLPRFGVAAKREVLSVNLYTQVPLIALDKTEIGVTHHSITSISLLKILCRILWKIEPKVVPLDRQKPFSKYPAFLLIGDEALENQTVSGFNTIDLASAWHELTALPFVFALFAIRSGVSLNKIAAFRNELHQALSWSEKHREIIEKEAVKRSGLAPDLIERYYTNLQFRLGKEEMNGLNLFQKFRKY